MNLEDLNLSHISKKPSMTDLGSRDLQQLEWKFSDCLKLNNYQNSNNNKENILEEICQNTNGRNSIESRKSMRKSSFNDQIEANELQEKNKQLQQINQDNYIKLRQLDKENEQLRQQLQSREVKKTKSIINQPSKPQSVILLADQNISNIQNGSKSVSMKQLSHIPESEAEETPMNRPTLKSYQKNTFSFAQYSADQDNSAGGSKKKKKTEQKINMMLNNGGISGLGSSVRRLFPSTTSNTPSSSTFIPQNRNSSVSALSDQKYDSITPKIDSNLEKKHYHDEIVRKNKLKFQNFSSYLNSSLQNDSVDMTLISQASCQNSNIKPINMQLFNNNDDSLSKISCYEDFNHVFNAPQQSQNVKLKYYQYILEESFFQQEKFTQAVASSINNEQTNFQNNVETDQKQANKLLDYIQKQQKCIEKLTTDLTSSQEKSEKLSQLVLMYKEQIIKMNSNNEVMSQQMKEIQDELSTIELFFQFEDDVELLHLRNNETILNLEALPTQFQNGIERIKENVSAFTNKIAELNNLIQQNKEDYTFQLQTLNIKLEAQLRNHEENSQYSFPSSLRSKSKQRDLQDLYQILSQNVEKTIYAMAKLEKEKQQQKDLILSSKLEKENLRIHLQKVNENQKNDFDELLLKLAEQFKQLKQQQKRLEDELFEVKLDKKRVIYKKLGKKLECNFMHSSKAVEDEIMSSLKEYELNGRGTAFNQENIQQQLEMLSDDTTEPQFKELEHFNAFCLSKVLYKTVKNQHDNLKEYKNLALEYMKLFEWLELCITINDEGEFKMNESFLTEIQFPELVEWAQIFKNNLQICIQQHIKRQVESKIDLGQSDKNTLKKFIYSGSYSEYFSYLFYKILKATPSSANKQLFFLNQK